MHKISKIFIVVLGVVFFVSVVSYGAYRLMNSRTYQIFGTIINRVETDQKIVALTFDDAPTEHTNDVLKILADKEIHATFYMIGQQIEKYPDVAKAIVAQGNELGNHSYSHQRMIFKSQSFIDDEIQKTNNLIREAGYNGEITFRAPNSKKLIGLPWYLWNHNIKNITADVEPDTYGLATDFFVDYTIKNTKSGSIILIHPFCDKCSAQRESLPLIIDALKKEGYNFVTVSELLESISY